MSKIVPALSEEGKVIQLDESLQKPMRSVQEHTEILISPLGMISLEILYSGLF